jgi:hypothetical protein
MHITLCAIRPKLLLISMILFGDYSNSLDLNHEIGIGQVLHSDRRSRRRHLTTAKNLVPLLIHPRIVPFHGGEIYHGIDQVLQASFASRSACDDLVYGAEDCSCLDLDVGNFIVLDTSNATVREHARNARDVDGSASTGDRSGLWKFRGAFRCSGIQKKDLAVGRHSDDAVVLSVCGDEARRFPAHAELSLCVQHHGIFDAHREIFYRSRSDPCMAPFGVSENRICKVGHGSDGSGRGVSNPTECITLRICCMTVGRRV